jgi:hypothetical protein
MPKSEKGGGTVPTVHLPLDTPLDFISYWLELYYVIMYDTFPANKHTQPWNIFPYRHIL